MRLWNGQLPDRPLDDLVRELYDEENRDKANPSGSQDMIGLIYPGINRLDYDFKIQGGVFPSHIESCNDPKVARWLSDILHIIPVEPRPEGYSPLGIKNLTSEWTMQLGKSGQDCYKAIIQMNAQALGQSFNLTMKCWETLLPHVVRHPKLDADLMPLLEAYQSQYLGAMYSGCGGGYLMVVSEEPVPGAFKIEVRVTKQ
jgi:hypothetical protein